MYYCHTYSILPLLLLSLPKKASSIPGELSQDSTLTGPRLYAVKWQQVNVILYFYVNDILTEYGTSTALSLLVFSILLSKPLCAHPHPPPCTMGSSVLQTVVSRLHGQWHFGQGGQTGGPGTRLEGRQREKTGCFSLSLLQETSQAVTPRLYGSFQKRPFTCGPTQARQPHHSLSFYGAAPAWTTLAPPVLPGHEVVEASCTF